MKFIVCDVIAIEHEIQIPNECPGCLKPVELLTLVQYEATGQKVTVRKLDDGSWDTMDWNLSEHYEGYLPLAWQCSNCQYEFGSGYEGTVPHASEHPLQALSKEINNLINKMKETTGWKEKHNG